jgi:hypothetical protein
MGDTIRGSDFDCRYIRELPWSGGSGFTRFAQKLGVVLPSGIELSDAITWGWISPVLRVALPPDYFTDWVEHPVITRRSKVRDEHRWADAAVRLDFGLHLRFRSREEPLSRRWYLHPLDLHDDPLMEDMKRHAVAAPYQPDSIVLANGRKISPYVDFFNYWSVYHLAESIEAATLAMPILNTPTAEVTARALLEQIGAHVSYSNGRIAHARARHESAFSTFDWISLYRTAEAASLLGKVSRATLRKACHQILDLSGRTVESLKDEIRDVLLTRWQDFRGSENDRLPPLKTYLQQDIKRAIDFLESVTRRPTDYRDVRWYFTGFEPPANAQLHEVLPFEHWLAQESFPRYAGIYLRSVARLKLRGETIPTSTAAIRKAMIRRWATSYAFRRFLISFHRLHELLNSDRHSLITFREHNTVDYMVLGCLVVERMIAEWWIERNPQAPKMPPLDLMLVDLANELTSILRVRSVEQVLKGNKKRADLYGLKRGDRLPFLRAPRSGRELVASTLHNLRVFRNYSAHHDALDFELTFRREGARAMRTIVAAVALLLALPDRDAELPSSLSASGD